MLVADLPQSLKVALGGRDVTSLAENGLENKGGGITGGSVLLEEELEAVQSLLDKLVVRGRVRKAKLVPVRVRSREDTGLLCTTGTVSFEQAEPTNREIRHLPSGARNLHRRSSSTWSLPSCRTCVRGRIPGRQ